MKLKLLRVSHNMTQKEISEKLGYERSYYGHIENCRRKGSQNFWVSVQNNFNLTENQVQELREDQTTAEES